MYKLVNWPGARATAIFEFFFINGFENKRTRRRVTHLTAAELWPSWLDTEPNRVPSVPTAHETASVFVIAGLLRVDGAAYRGVRTPRARPMRMRAAARGDQSERRAEGGGGESRAEERR